MSEIEPSSIREGQGGEEGTKVASSDQAPKAVEGVAAVQANPTPPDACTTSSDVGPISEECIFEGLVDVTEQLSAYYPPTQMSSWAVSNFDLSQQPHHGEATAHLGGGRQQMRRSTIPSKDELFSLHLVIESASLLKKPKYGRPYVTVYGLSCLHPDVRTLVARALPTPESALDPNHPTWNFTLSGRSVWPTDMCQFEVSDWVDGVRDPLLGVSELLRFPFRSAETSDLESTHIEVLRLFPRASSGGSKDCMGHINIRYTMGPSTLERSSAVAPQLDVPHLDIHTRNYGVTLPNFRDIGGWPVQFRDRHSGKLVSGRFRTGLVFRTSAIHRATERDAHIITHILKIRSLIDLRTPDCSGNRGPYLTCYYNVLKPSSTGIRAKTKFSRTEWNQSETQIKFLLRDYQNTVITSELQKKEINPEELAQMKILQQADGVDFDYDHESALYPSIDSAGFGKLYLISLVGARFQLAIVRKSSKRQVVRAGLSADTPQAQRRALCAPIFDRPDGLSVLYQLLVKHSFQEFCLFFNTLLDIQFPIAYFCNHGKDRTGMCTALLLSLCGVDRSTIIDNYALSDSLLLPIKQIVDFEMTDAGQDPAIMSRTPPEAMAFILDYIDRIYGGVPEYLKHIGFGYRKQHTLRTKLVDVDHIDQSSFKFTGLLLIIEKATNLPVSALRSTVDSYVVLKLSSSDPKQLLSRVHQTIGATPVIPKTVNPVWNQKCHLPILHSSSKLIFEVWKANRVRGDRILGFTTFECDKLPFPSKGVHHFHLPLTAPKLSASKDHVSHLVREVSGTLSITLDYSAVRAAVMPRSDPVIRIPESDHLCHTPRSTTAGPLPTPPE